MPQVFKIGAYLVYFWLNEGMDNAKGKMYCGQ